MTKLNRHIQKAVKICGSQSKLAKACGVSQTAVWNWLHGSRISPENAIAVEMATVGQVPRDVLRGDVFGVDRLTHGG
jgi:DNA-binding transcriptional regulator YdaS (Cro superfamily)